MEQGSVIFKAAATATAASAAFPPFCKMRMPACKQCHFSNTMGSESWKNGVHGCHIPCLSAARVRLQNRLLQSDQADRQARWESKAGGLCADQALPPGLSLMEIHKGCARILVYLAGTNSMWHFVDTCSSPLMPRVERMQPCHVCP